MAIYRMLQGAAFGPEGIEAMTTAYEDALQELKLTDRCDPLTEVPFGLSVGQARGQPHGLGPGSGELNCRGSFFSGLIFERPH
jgi:hypothetical protein